MPVLKFSLGGNIREGESIHPFILNQTTRVHTQTAHKPHIHKQNVVKSTLQTTEKKRKTAWSAPYLQEVMSWINFCQNLGANRTSMSACSSAPPPGNSSRAASLVDLIISARCWEKTLLRRLVTALYQLNHRQAGPPVYSCALILSPQSFP